MITTTIQKIAASSLCLFLGVATETSAQENDRNTPLDIEPITLDIAGYLSDTLVETTIDELETLREQNPHQTIRIKIADTRGGALEAGFKLSHAINQLGDIDLECAGNLQSMMANIFVSYQGGKRIASESCTNFMLHDIIYTTPTKSIGTASFVRTHVDGMMENLRTPFRMMTQATANATGMSIESASALFGEDCHLTPHQAYSLKLLDEFEDATNSTFPEQLTNPDPAQIYEICGTAPLESYFDYTDWSQYEFNGIPSP